MVVYAIPIICPGTEFSWRKHGDGCEHGDGQGTGFQKEKTEKKPMRNDERARKSTERAVVRHW